MNSNIEAQHIKGSWIEVAIKTLKPIDEEDYKMSDAWDDEARAHRELNMLENPHIIKGIAAFAQHGDYHLVLEWSDGDLRSFWAANPKPELSRERILEVLKELRGLASALEAMHEERARLPMANGSKSGRSSTSGRNGAIPNTATKDFAPLSIVGQAPYISKVNGNAASTVVQPLLRIQIDQHDEPNVNPDQRENRRHGDIKPENILRFDTESRAEESEVVQSRWLGQLKLADLGRAKQRFQVTQKMTQREYDDWRTKPYDSPDDYVGGQTTSMSRLYDIWSLGCVSFEMVIWLLYGVEAHHSFSQKAIEERCVGTPYWTKKGEFAQVDTLVTMWVDEMLKSDPACVKGRTALGDLLILIQERLLVVELPPLPTTYTPKCRTNAADMVKELDVIIAKATAEPSYLYSKVDRKNIKSPLPRTMRVINPAEESGENGGLAVMGAESAVMDAESVAQTAGPMSRYTRNLTQNWHYVPDDEFAAAILDLHDEELLELFEARAASCAFCKSLDLNNRGLEFERSWEELQPKKRGNKCELCVILFHAAERTAQPGEQFLPSKQFYFKRVPGALQLNGGIYPVLRVCRKPGMDSSFFHLSPLE
jgi:serine/threonine protein kinase